MKINKFLILIGLAVFFFLGIFVGLKINNTQDNKTPININPLSKSCQYNGKTYKSGEGFLDEDGCNSCSCEDGKVACTAMACER